MEAVINTKFRNFTRNITGINKPAIPVQIAEYEWKIWVNLRAKDDEF